MWLATLTDPLVPHVAAEFSQNIPPLKQKMYFLILNYTTLLIIEMLLIILISAFFNPFALLTIKNSSALLGAYSLPVNFSFSLFKSVHCFSFRTKLTWN